MLKNAWPFWVIGILLQNESCRTSIHNLPNGYAISRKFIISVLGDLYIPIFY